MAASAGTQNYWRASRSPRYSILFAMPLLLAYEALSVALPPSETHGVRNGAEVIMVGAFDAVAGRYGPAMFGLLMIGICSWLVTRDVAREWRARSWLGVRADAAGVAAARGRVRGHGVAAHASACSACCT